MIDFSICLLFLAFSIRAAGQKHSNGLNQLTVQSVGSEVCSAALAQVPDGVDCADLLAIPTAMY